MKDRFKFRVWDKPLEKYMEFKEFRFMNVEFTFNPITKEAEIEYDKERYIVEQCTGLNDKNGKPIYEGDILKPNSNTITKEVVYEDGSYWAKDTIYFHDKCHIFQKWIDECGYEIVGNIHEKESK